jgi:GSH-dependent disulfide-bond oxidoreductase
MIELFYWPTPNGWKITIMLEECGLPYTVTPVRIGRGEQFMPAFDHLNPNNRVPVIVDHDAPGGQPVTIFESGAILAYLAERTGVLQPIDVAARYRVLQWVMWQMSGLGPMAGQNGHFLLYAPEKIPYAIERYGQEVRRLYNVLDKQLRMSGSYIAGDYSIADIACFPWIMTHKAQGLTLNDTPDLRRWFATVRARPQVQRGLAVMMGHKTAKIDNKARSVLFGQQAQSSAVK